MNYSVSVIIPVYNCEKYLERSIESVISQSLFNECELILVDDGSTDNSPAICDSYCEKYENVKALHQQNAGVSVARNKGIEASTGEWICFVDSDDYLLQDALTLTKKYHDSDIICSSHDSNAEPTPELFEYLTFGTFMTDEIRESLVKSMAARQYFYSCWAKLFKRSIIIENSVYFPEGRKLAEDMVFVFSYLACCKTISFSEKKTYHYFVNDDNTTNVIAESFDTFKFIYNWKTEYFKNNGWYSDEIKSILIDFFVWHSFLSFKSAATYLSLSKAVNYLNKCFNDTVFYDFYLLKDYKIFRTFFDKVLDWSIRNRNSVPFCVFSKLNYYKSTIFKKLLR